MDESILLKEQVEGVLKLTLNRPEKYNSLSNDLMEQLHDALLAFGENETQKCCLIIGAGKHFCSGADIKQFGDKEAQTEEMIAYRAKLTMETHGMAARLGKPIITCVRGYALAGGCGLALSGDLVLASETALFGYPECSRGFVPALVMVNLSKLVGRHRALELLLTGKKITADKALDWGLINEVVPDKQLEQRGMELAIHLSQIPASAMSRTKNLFYKVEEMDLLDGLEEARAVNEAMRKTKDFAAGVSDFKNGKKA